MDKNGFKSNSPQISRRRSSSVAPSSPTSSTDPQQRIAELEVQLATLERFLTLKFGDWRAEVERANRNAESPKEWTLLPTKNASIMNGGLTLSRKGVSSRSAWECNTIGSVGWLSGVHQWTIHLDTTCEMMVGVATSNTNRTGPNWSNNGYYFSTSSGALFGQDGTWKKDYYSGKCSRKGTEISVRLDLDARTLSFAVNGEQLPIAWNNLAVTGPLHPEFRC